MNSLTSNNSRNCPHLTDEEEDVQRGESATQPHEWSAAVAGRTMRPPAPHKHVLIPGAGEHAVKGDLRLQIN